MLEIKKEHCKVSHFHLYELWKEGQITKEQYILKKKQFIIQEEQYQTKNIDKNFPDLVLIILPLPLILRELPPIQVLESWLAL